jgi:hypothetical protein
MAWRELHGFSEDPWDEDCLAGRATETHFAKKSAQPARPLWGQKCLLDSQHGFHGICGGKAFKLKNQQWALLAIQ